MNMTRVPKIAPPELPKLGQQQVVLSYELVTPMYGGGKESQKPDTAMPVRASAIRGQLRAWWRLLASSQYDAKTLRTEEFDLWGGPDKNTPKASRVMLQVRQVKNAKPEPWARYEKKPDGSYKGLPTPQPWANAAYALFPAQGKAPGQPDSANPHELIKAGMTFDLVIGFSAPINPKQQELLWQSVRWWSQFGGLGARTRRGLGAIQLKQVSDHSLKETLLKNIDTKEAQQYGCSLIKAGRPSRDATQAWTDAISKLQRFRQGVDLGRNAGQQANRPGRSRWPEADSIREVMRKSDPQHRPVHPARQSFPRAAFGLPIIFHFQSRTDPGDTSLNPIFNGKKAERMSSPIILRPTNDAQDRWFATALLLPHEHVQSLRLDLSNNDVAYWSANKANQVRPIANHNGSNALDAFMNYFGEN
jgi:CRISPR-associated protein Cmr1